MNETALPTGTVTFLFTDVEGSTELWEADHGAMRSALAEHDAILHAAITAHHGSVFKTIGDAFCAAFVRPEDALDAALSAQRAIASHAWPPALESLRVRMGIHTGSAVESNGDYFGPTVNRVARLMSIGHGEQILVSSTTAMLLRDVMPPGSSLRDLGIHRLKGLNQPENAYQVVADGLRADFPALRSSDAPVDVAVPPHNLPHALTTFFGRDAELSTVTTELTRYRLVTLAGFGGVGKTRMAIEAGWQLLSRFDDAVYLVELAPLADPALVAARIAVALGVPAQAGQLAGDLWIDAVRQRRLLLVLDNCEHVLDAASAVAQHLLERCPHIHILATSREPLRLPGERVVRIAPLAPPATAAHDGAALGSFMDSPAVKLFLDRVSNADPSFAIRADDDATWNAVASVCRRLDGIPLAIELAAARVSTLGLPRLVAGLDNRFRLLTGGSRTSLPRHQTLQATLDWSYAVLGDDEQHVFARLGVFAGTFTAEAAAAVCATDRVAEDDAIAILSSLVDRSLVVADSSSATPRYRLLETTRAYALARLKERADLDVTRRAHAVYFQAIAAQVRSMFGSSTFMEWVAAYRADVDNFRGALAWMIEERGDVLLGATMLCDLKRLFEWLMLNDEGLAWCERALAELGSDAPPAIEAELLTMMTRHHMALGAFHVALPLIERAVTVLRGSGDELGLGMALLFYGRAQASQPQLRDAAARAMDEAVAIFERYDERTGHKAPANEMETVIRLHAILARAHQAFTIDPRDVEGRRALLAEAVERFTALAPGHFIIGITLSNLAELSIEAGDYARALDEALRAYDFYHGPGSGFGYIWALNALGAASHALGAVADARAYASELLTVAQRIGSAPGLGMALLLLAAAEASDGDAGTAAGLLGAWETCAGKIDTPFGPTQYLCERTTTALRDAIGEQGVTQGVAAGRRWSLDDAIAAAQRAADRTEVATAPSG